MYGFSLGQTQYVSNLSYTNLSLSKTVTLKNIKKSFLGSFSATYQEH